VCRADAKLRNQFLGAAEDPKKNPELQIEDDDTNFTWRLSGIDEITTRQKY
jgi:hypothetical protein